MGVGLLEQEIRGRKRWTCRRGGMGLPSWWAKRMVAFLLHAFLSANSPAEAGTDDAMGRASISFHESAILFQSNVVLAHSRIDSRTSSVGGCLRSLTASRMNWAFCSGSVMSKWKRSDCSQSSFVFFE